MVKNNSALISFGVLNLQIVVGEGGVKKRLHWEVVKRAIIENYTIEKDLIVRK